MKEYKEERIPLFILFLPVIFFCSASFCQSQDTIAPEIKVHIGTFLGNEKRNYYGNEAPENLKIVWKLYLGKGKTVISRNIGEKIWAGAGWTGQPLVIEEDSDLYLIQGAYDHNLKKIRADSGKIVWQYGFADQGLRNPQILKARYQSFSRA